MHHHQSEPFPRRATPILSLAGIFFLLAGCSRDPQPEETAADYAPAHETREPLIEIVELQPDEAARDREEIQSEVSVNLMDGFEVSLWASEKLLGDPVALDVDDHGRVFVTQTTRHRQSEFDIRDRRDWMIPSITWETVEDRRAFLREELAPERSDENSWLPDRNQDGSHDWRDLAVLQERVFRIEDTRGDGLADRSQVLYEGFNEEISDIAAGVLAYGDDVYVTVAPDLWRLRDTTGDGWADEKQSIAHGFGVHIGFSGHGLSGPIVGPDGRIYWAIGDYGINVEAPDGSRWEYPNTGVIMRADPDGSDFEVFASGVRNTHEFAFDQYGNLVSVDNDGDHGGEHERFVYLVDGSDSGWRINWQFGKYGDPANNSYKVWMDEELFRPRFEDQAAYILPPIAAFRSGPSGFAYNPGTAFTEEWKDHFFVTHFVGSPPQSRIVAFNLEESGAGFELGRQETLLSGLLPTSLAFAPDGALYFADWISGWGMNGNGRIWTLDTPETRGSDLRRETEALIRANFSERSIEDLAPLLHHPDMRVRQKSQFELVRRGDDGATALLGAVEQTEEQLARVHGLWGLGQMIRAGNDLADHLTPFLADEDPEIRAQTARVLGDVRHEGAGEALIGLLHDEHSRPKFFAAEALGRIGHQPAVEAIAEMLVENDDRDAYLRHGGAIALARIGRAEPLSAYADHPSRALRIASVVALRRMEDPGVAAFLSDEDELVVVEAARAINDDRSIPAALPALARTLEEERFTREPLLRRAINANLRVGDQAAARRLAAYALRSDAPEAMRVEALDVLAVWPEPSILDRVDGWHRGPLDNDPALAREAVSTEMEYLLTAEPNPAVRSAAIEVAGRLAVRDAAPLLMTLLREDGASSVRAAALNALNRMESDLLPDAVERAMADTDSDVRRTALDLAPSLDSGGPELANLLAVVVDEGSLREQQTALSALGRLGNERAFAHLEDYLAQLVAGDFPRELHLDLIEAAEATEHPPLIEALAQYRATRPRDDAVAAFAETLYGGHIATGRQIFRGHPAASCVRCHAIQGRGGDAGPDLTNLAARSTREEILQALVAPNARITPGYGIVTLNLQDGERIIGILREESDARLEMDIGGEVRSIARSDVAERIDAPSSMPSVEPVLTKREIRDLLAYLASLD